MLNEDISKLSDEKIYQMIEDLNKKIVLAHSYTSGAQDQLVYYRDQLQQHLHERNIKKVFEQNEKNSKVNLTKDSLQGTEDDQAQQQSRKKNWQ